MSDSANTSRALRSVPVFRILMVLVLILIVTLIPGTQRTSLLSALSETENAQPDVPGPVTLTSHSTETGHRSASPDKTQVTALEPTQPYFPLDISKLILVGVVLSSDNLSSHAIIEYQSNQDNYSIGDTVYHHQILLTQITNQSATIEYQQKSHTLYLQKSIYQPLRSTVSENSAVDEREKDQAPDLSQYIAVTPVYEQGILNGLLATPKGDSSVFLQLGLMSEDIITEINGVSMTSTEGVRQASALLQSEGNLQLSIRRQGQIMTVFIDAPKNVL
jgi:general secretion pathway protein C